ncbi:NAD(P)-dependent oxidoreductase [Rurimicrobium arvi]|uniref:2-hydroxyacid dehydrogenase n=1 Tax=Rurimicrobium arvi TaxID=2049916 RepID=A0ABP8MJV0_9BACT
MDRKGKVLIAAPVHDVLTTGLAAAGYELVWSEQISQEEAFRLLPECVGVITSTRLQLNRELIDAAPMLEFIGRMGSGMEVIDVAYADQKGIRCIGSPEGNCNAVAEHAMGMLLSLTKRITKSFSEVRSGLWLRDENRGMELEGKTVGIIGFGHTGSAFAKLLSAFNMRILAYDKYHPVAATTNITPCNSLEPVFREADIISFHVPQQEDTHHLFNREFATAMQKPFILLNTSRGTVVDSELLPGLLQSGKMTALGLDVWEEEPLSKMSAKLRIVFNELITLPNVVITPHIAGYSVEALFKMSDILLKRII